MRRMIKLLLLFSLLAGPVSCVPVPRAAQEPLPVLMSRAEPLIAGRRYGDAVAALEEAARLYAGAPLPLVKIGQIYLTQHRWLLAEDAFNRALARNPAQAAAMAGLAEALFRQQRLAEAQTWWQHAAQVQPQLPGVFTGLGRTQVWLFDFEAARRSFAEQQAHRFDPEAQWFLAALTAPLNLAAAVEALQSISPAAAEAPDEELLAQRDYLLAALAPFSASSPPGEAAKAAGIALAQIELWPLAVQALTIAAAPGPAEAETLAFLGHALAQAGRPALDLFEQARRLEPESALPLYFEGLYLRQQGAVGAAENRFRQAATLDPDNAAIYVELARTKTQQGNLGTAELWYEAAVQVSQGDRQFQRLLALFYADRGYRLEEAGLPAAEALVEADKNDATAYELLGRMQFLAGKPDGGAASLRQALALDPNLIGARYYLARLLETQGQPEAALAEYRRVVDWDTVGEFRERALKDMQRLGAE
ncbi:MAG: tetratricopeptide repeat protein [Chloroflexota bacterium]